MKHSQACPYHLAIEESVYSGYTTGSEDALVANSVASPVGRLNARKVVGS